jgi:hypothetical protein
MTEAELELFTLAQRDTVELVLSVARDWLRDQPLHNLRGDEVLQAFVELWERQLHLGEQP